MQLTREAEAPHCSDSPKWLSFCVDTVLQSLPVLQQHQMQHSPYDCICVKGGSCPLTVSMSGKRCGEGTRIAS